jgi:hypothetical protein
LPPKIENHEVKFRFENAQDWSDRGKLEVSRDAANGKIVGVTLKNNKIDSTLQRDMEDHCQKDELYQLSVPDLHLLTSIPACHYSKAGFNDTLIFNLDLSGKSLSSVSYDIIDVNFLASLEKNPRKKRIMTTKQFEIFETKASLQPLVEGPKPIFTKYKYDSIGRELKEKSPEQQQAEEPQSFFGKYWLYIVIGFLVLPNLLGQ